MDPKQSVDKDYFQRLLDEQSSCIESTRHQIEQLEKFRQDYESVIRTVLDLQKSVSKSALLPFGRKAFVPGRLVHTNELLVYLGGHAEYFTKLSASETIQLMNRRIESLNSKIEGLTQQKKLLEDRVPYTKDLTSIKPLSSTNTNAVQGMGDSEEFEIREDYNSDEESKWKEKHKLNRQRERAEHAKLDSPVLKHPRKVSFDLSSTEYRSNEDSDSTPSSTGSDLSDPCTIRFSHTPIPSPIPRSHIPDLSTMTVAEAVNLAQESLTVSTSHTLPLRRPDPFGNIVERKPTSSIATEPSHPETKRVSRFRAQRQPEKEL